MKRYTSLLAALALTSCMVEEVIEDKPSTFTKEEASIMALVVWIQEEGTRQIHNLCGNERAFFSNIYPGFIPLGDEIYSGINASYVENANSRELRVVVRKTQPFTREYTYQYMFDIVQGDQRFDGNPDKVWNVTEREQHEWASEYALHPCQALEERERQLVKPTEAQQKLFDEGVMYLQGIHGRPII